MTAPPPQSPHRRAADLPAWLRRAHERAAEGIGQAMVEMALLLPLLLLLVFGITQFGLALNTTNDQTQLASVIARNAAVNYNPGAPNDSLSAWGLKQADTNMVSNGGTVSICFPNGTANIGDPVKVTVSTTMDWQPLYGISQLIPGGVLPAASSTISGSATMRLEAPPSNYSGATSCP